MHGSLASRRGGGQLDWGSEGVGWRKELEGGKEDLLREEVRLARDRIVVVQTMTVVSNRYLDGMVRRVGVSKGVARHCTQCMDSIS